MLQSTDPPVTAKQRELEEREEDARYAYDTAVGVEQISTLYRSWCAIASELQGFKLAAADPELAALLTAQVQGGG